MEESRWAAVSHRQKNASRHMRRIKLGKTRPLMEVNKHQYILVMQNNDTLTSQLLQKEAEIVEAGKVEAERDDLLDKLHELERVRELLRQELGQAKTKSINHQKEIGLLQSHMREKEKRIYELENKKDSVQRLAEYQLRRRHDTLERDWDVERENYEEKVTNLEMEIEALKEDKQDLKDRMIANENELFQLRDQENKLASRVKFLKQDYTDVIDVKSRMNDKMADVEKNEKALKNRLEKIERKVNQLKEDKTKLKATLKLKSKQLKECETFKQEHASHKRSSDEKLEDLKSQIQTFEATLKDKDKTIKSLEKEKSKATKDLFTSKEELLTLQSAFQEKLFGAQRAHEETRQELMQSRNEASTAKSDNINQSKEISKLQDELKELKETQLLERQRMLELQAAASTRQQRHDSSSSDSDSGNSSKSKKQRKRKKKKSGKRSDESSTDKETNEITDAGGCNETDTASTATADQAGEEMTHQGKPCDEGDDKQGQTTVTTDLSENTTDRLDKEENPNLQASEADHKIDPIQNGGKMDAADDKEDEQFMGEMEAELRNVDPESENDDKAEEEDGYQEHAQQETAEDDRMNKEEVDKLLNELRASHEDKLKELTDDIQRKEEEIEKLQETIQALKCELEKKSARPKFDKDAMETIQALRDTIRRNEAKVLEKDFKLHDLQARIEKLQK